ncbi:MAG: hypothetical protein JNM56_31890 [Planctomycetia bacterium]|nr:hypothetical protein [Planctomycetia bacterium]
MSHSLTVELSATAFEALSERARAVAQSPATLAAAALERQFGNPATPSDTEARRAAARRFERHFGALSLGRATGADNDAIDADLARAYADPHDAP